MKKLLACTVAAIMAASMMTACGDKEEDTTSSKADTSSAAAAEESTAEESAAEESAAEESAAEESAAEESAADESAADESAADESAADESAADGEAEGPKDISEMPGTLKNLETASLKFTTDMDVSEFFGPFAEKDYEGTDESHIEFGVEEVEGVPMLRVQTLDMNDAGTNYKIPKIQFDMSKLFAGQTDKLADIMTVDIEFMTKAEGMFTAADGTESLVPGNFMGSIAAKTGADNAWKEINSDISEGEWTSEWATYVETGRVGIMGPFEAIEDPQYLCFMRWGIPNQQDFYIVDITFYDADGNVIPCSIGAE